LERLSRLDVEAREVLRAAAVLSDPAAEDVLVAVSGLAPGAGREGLAGALECGLITQDGPGRMGFGHGLAARAGDAADPGVQGRGREGCRWGGGGKCTPGGAGRGKPYRPRRWGSGHGIPATREMRPAGAGTGNRQPTWRWPPVTKQPPRHSCTPWSPGGICP